MNDLSDLLRSNNLLKIELNLLEYIKKCESYKSYYEEVWKLSERSIGSYTLDHKILIENFGKEFDWKSLVIEKLNNEIDISKKRIRERSKPFVEMLKILPEVQEIIKNSI